jgi:hypothetical protein
MYGSQRYLFHTRDRLKDYMITLASIGCLTQPVIYKSTTLAATAPLASSCLISTINRRDSWNTYLKSIGYQCWGDV